MPRMRAAQVVSAKGPYQIVEREMPEPDAGQVRIRVQASGVCHSDSLTKEGIWPGLQYPRVPGHEVAGIVDAVGAGVAGWKVGDRVGVGWHGGHCGHCDACRHGDFLVCQVAALVPGISYDGGHADYMIAPAVALARIPEGLSAADAAPLMCAGVILATGTSAKAMTATIGCLAVDGKLVVLGAAHEPLEVTALALIGGRRSIAGWPSGRSIDSQDTMAFSVLTGVRSMNEL